METWIIGQPTHALSKNMEEQGEAHVYVVAAYVNRMEVELQKTINMIMDQRIVTIIAMLE
jgi:hypothetical protein